MQTALYAENTIHLQIVTHQRVTECDEKKTTANKSQQ